MHAVLTIAGVALIVAALRDVFHTLFHPLGSGRIGQALGRAIWHGSRHWDALRPLAGPVTMVAVVATWAGLLAIGWTLVLWPRLPGGFLIDPGLDRENQGSFLDALYLSVVTLATLGYGDITPQTGWMRLLVPLEAVVGFGLLTASISWVLSVYPVLARRRVLSREVALFQDAEVTTGIGPSGPDPAGERLLADLIGRVIAVREDLAQFPVTYYFHAPDPRSNLAAALPGLLRLAEEAQQPGRPAAVRFQGALLRAALADLGAVLGRGFLDLPDAPLGDVLAAYAADHPTDRDARNSSTPATLPRPLMRKSQRDKTDATSM